MEQDLLLKFAQPMLIGIGLIVAMNIGNIVLNILNSRKDKDTKTQSSIEKLNESVMKLSFKIETLEKDLNNIAHMVKSLKSYE